MPAFGRGRGRHEAAEEVREKLGRFAGRPRFNAEFEEAFEFFFGESVEHLQEALAESDFHRFMEWFIYDYRLANGHRLIEIFDLEHGADLSRSARRLLREWEQASLTVFELQDRDDNECILLDLLRGKRYEVVADSVNPDATRWSLIISRALPLGDKWELSYAQTILSPVAKELMLSLLRGEYRRHRHLHGDLPVYRFLREYGFLFNDLLTEIDIDESASFLEGDESYRLMHCRALFSVMDEEKVIERLSTYVDTEEYVQGRLYWYDTTDPKERRIMAEMVIGNGRLHVHCWSKERLDMAKRLLVERLRGLVFHLVDAFEELHTRKNGESVHGSYQAATPNVAYQDYVTRWQTQPLEALDGRSPDSLKKKPLGRIRIAELLKKLEHYQGMRFMRGRGFSVAEDLRLRLDVQEEQSNLLCLLDQPPSTWNDEAEKLVADLTGRSLDAAGLSPEHIDAALCIWWDYCYRAYPLVRKAEAWAAALHYVVAVVEGWEHTQEEIAAVYGVSASTVSQNSRKLINLLDIEEYDDRYCVEHPVDGLLERLGRMYFRHDADTDDPTTFGLALAARMRDEARAAAAHNEGLRERAGEIFYEMVGGSENNALCRESFGDWFHFDWRVPVMGGRTLVKDALDRGAFKGEAKEIMEAWADCHPSFYTVEGMVEGGSFNETSVPRLTLRECVSGVLNIVDWIRMDGPITPKSIVFARLVPLGSLTISLGPVLTLPPSWGPILKRLIEEDRALVNRWNEEYIEWDEYRARYAERLYALAFRLTMEVGGDDD